MCIKLQQNIKKPTGYKKFLLKSKVTTEKAKVQVLKPALSL